MNGIEIIVLPPSTRGLCLTKHECYRNTTATFHQRSLNVTCVHICHGVSSDMCVGVG